MTGQAFEPMPESPGAVRPLVAKAVSNRSVWVFGIIAVILGTGLFATLEMRRTDPNLSAIAQRTGQGQEFIAAPAPLTIPELAIAPEPSTTVAPQMPFFPGASPRAVLVPTIAQPVSRPVRPAAQTNYVPPAPYSLPPSQPVVSPAIVYQAPPQPMTTSVTAPAETQNSNPMRVDANRLANPGTTIPQGTVIQAVLETALDSNHPGPARAIVSRDVKSFDGSRVLIPRGSRLIGEYKADVQSGQNRVMIQWIRLMRPDGVIIALDSPSADQLGRAGVKGKVDSHFWQRFGSAFLQTTLNIGANLATNAVGGGTVILGLPGSSQSVTASQPQAFRPTIKVPQGAQVTVFVARDLDFTRVEQGQ